MHLSSLFSSSQPRKLNTVYTSVLPLLLLIDAGLVYWFVDEGMFGWAAAVMALVGAYVFLDFLFGKTSISVLKVFGLSYCLGFGLSSFNTWSTNHREPDSLALFVSYSDRTLCHGLAFTALSAALFFFLGEVFETGITVDTSIYAESNEIVWFVWSAFFVVVAAFINGSLGYMGVTNTGGKVALLGAVAYWCVPPLFALTLCQAIHAKTAFKRASYWMLLAAAAIMVLPLGRRVLIYTFFLAGLLARFDPKVAMIGIRSKVAISLVALTILGAGTFGFLYLRFATYEFANDESISLFTLASEAVRVFQERPYSEVVEVAQKNVEARGFILGYSAAVLDFSETQPVAKAEGLLNAFTLAVPSALNPDKLGNIPEQEEYLVNRLYHTAYIDEANTLLSAGAVDFGYVGALLYPLLAAIVTSLLLRKVNELLSPTVAVVVTLAAIYTLLNIETTLASYLVLIRDSSLYSVLLTVLLRLRPRRSVWARGVA